MLVSQFITSSTFLLSLSRYLFFNDTATTEIYTLSLHDALPIWYAGPATAPLKPGIAELDQVVPPSLLTPATIARAPLPVKRRSEEHTSELQSLRHLVCRLLLEKKKTGTT